MPVQQARMELAPDTEQALAGHIDAQVKPGSREHKMLEPTNCPVCLGNTFGPAVMVNAPCQHHFHRRCIDPVLERDGGACPCRTPLRPGEERVVEARRHWQMMGDLPVKCPQCEEVLPFEQLDGHVRKADGCPNTPFRCGNEGCGEPFLRKDTEVHINTCPHRIVTCGLCNAPVKSSELQQHEQEQCPRRTVSCPHCEREYVFCEKDEHLHECTGSAPMNMIVQVQQQAARTEEAARQQQQVCEQQIGQLRDQAAQQQQTIEQCQRTIAQQKQTIERQGQTIEQIQRTNVQQQQTIAQVLQATERQQREMAELREFVGLARGEPRILAQERLREEQEKAETPQRLILKRADARQAGSGYEYSRLPGRINGAAVWASGEFRIYRSRGGRWGVCNKREMLTNCGYYRLNSQPGSPAPLYNGGWQETPPCVHRDLDNADCWQPCPELSVTAA